MIINVSVNNEPRDIDEGCTIAEALAAWQFEAQQVAVAINTEFVPRSSYDTRVLHAGDCIDVLAPVQGG